MKGNGAITGSCFAPIKESSYMMHYKTPVITSKVKVPVMNFRISFAGNSMIPDPRYLTR